ncbi:sugar ABC transporter ATP-binding protein [Marvinbryantia formatexigens]|nr:sugar ABC transporter ATP-binding protein [Marvinbryantia formatexigens]UWO25942.1 sugar ABC transporter ATP-binding protein [Marvinbryantia formatexigens DSM 14469]SDF43939.1 ribose transport system ATP-binding protein [Marvinbryantia formatexigens]
MTPLMKLEHIDKQFPGVKALTDVNIEFYAGEIHALVGENGAGKSTMIKIILSAYKPTAGKIYYEGKEIQLTGPLEASALGIEAVHQELMLVPYLSVARNIFLNHEPKRPGTGLFDVREMERRAKELLEGFGVCIDVTRPVKEFSASVWKMIDIARVVNLKPRMIIFDEPTAILSEREVDSLMKKILELKREGVAIIYISHRLQEIEKLADKISILRDGHHVGTMSGEGMNEEEIVKRMVGRDVSSFYSRRINPQGEELLRMEHVNLKKGQKDISLNVHRGEIVGLAGLVGAGRTEVAESLFGMNRILSGEIYYRGERIRPRSVSAMINRGAYLVPENRKYEGLVLRFSVAANIALSAFGRWSRFFYNKKKETEKAEEMIHALSIKTPGRTQLVGNLSGGNQQKVVIGKAMVTESEFLIFDEPTVGVDVGAKEEIHNLMDEFVRKNGGILMISSDLPEIIGMCDRVYIMYEGKIVRELQREELSDKNIAGYMLGAKGGDGQ